MRRNDRSSTESEVDLARSSSKLLFLALITLLAACSSGGYIEPGQAAPDSALVRVPTLASLEQPQQCETDDPERIVRQFLDAWQQGDFEAMYALISYASQQATPYENFRALYESSHAEMRLIDLSYALVALAQDESNTRLQQLTYDMTFASRVMGSFDDAGRTLSLVLDPTVCDWRVAWTPADIFAAMGGGGRLRYQAAIPRRGSIYDRDQTALADQNGIIVTLNIVLNQIPDLPTCLATISAATGDPVETIQARLAVAGPEWLAEVGTVGEAEFPQWDAALTADCNVEYGRRYTRRYLEGGDLAPHALGAVGYLNPEDIEAAEALGFQQDSILGRSGIELAWDSSLRGQPGGRLVIVNSTGAELRELAAVPSLPAQSLYLTLDAGLQRAARDALAATYALYSPGWADTSRGGAAIVMNVNTGAILAMVSWPTFDNNALVPFPIIGEERAQQIIADLNDDRRIPLLNRVTLATYPSGSTFKAFTAIAAADSGVYSLTQRYSCSGVWPVPGLNLTRPDWLAGGHGTLTLAGGLVNSCNPYFYEAGYQLFVADPMLLPDYARRMGFGGATGIGIEENAGLIGDPQYALETLGLQWSVVDAFSMAIGQGMVEVTPLQMTRAYAAIANGGDLMRPQLVDSVRLIDEVSYEMRPEVSAEIGVRDDVLATVHEGLCGVTTAATGTARFVFENSPLQAIGVCGKTGTAQDQGPTPGLSHAWFVGYAPRDEPEIVVLAMVENSGEGSEIAAPIVRDILEYYFYGDEG
jgi:penicillin-binding protein 2